MAAESPVEADTPLLLGVGEAGRALVAARTAGEVAALAVRACRALVACDAVVVRFLDPSSGAVLQAAGDGLRTPAGRPGPIPVEEQVRHTRAPLAQRADGAGPADWAWEAGVRAQVVVPVPGPDGVPAGTLAALRRAPRAFDEGELARVLALAAATGAAVHATRLDEALQAASDAIHEVTNLLAVILLRAEMLLEPDAGDDPPWREALEAIRRAALEGRETVRRSRSRRAGFRGKN